MSFPSAETRYLAQQVELDDPGSVELLWHAGGTREASAALGHDRRAKSLLYIVYIAEACHGK